MAVDEVIIRTGATYRQLDHWCRKGYLHPENSGNGTGVPRHWSQGEIEVARRMRRLVDAGLKPGAAAKVARGEPQLAAGIRVEMT